MPPRARQSNAGPSRQSTVAPTPSQPARGGTQLPPYEAPSFPLNPKAQRDLDNLSRVHSLKKLDDSLADAQKALSEVAAEINDRLTEKETKLSRKRKAQTTEPTSEDAENAADGDEQNLDELRDKVSRMTTRMDESMRKIIDGQHSVQDIKASLAATATDARLNASTQASTQAASTQRRRRRVTEDGEEEDEEEYEDFEPTDPRGGTQAQKSALETFRAKIDDSKTRYQAHSLTDRYAQNNAYRDFKRVVHDARHPTGDVSIPHHNEWFNEGQAPAPGMTTRARNGGEDEDSDDDLAVSRTTISTKCPLTLTEFKQPLTSKKCPHSFEAEAILSLITGSNAHVGGGRSGEKTVQCPVSGCSQSLTKNDLHTDAVLVRQIKRLQRAREQLDDEDADEDDNDVDGPTVIGDDDVDDVDDIVEGRTQIKGEARSGRPKGRATPVTPMRNGGVVELGSDSEAEEGDEDMTQDE